MKSSQCHVMSWCDVASPCQVTSGFLISALLLTMFSRLVHCFVVPLPLVGGVFFADSQERGGVCHKVSESLNTEKKDASCYVAE